MSASDDDDFEDPPSSVTAKKRKAGAPAPKPSPKKTKRPRLQSSPPPSSKTKKNVSSRLPILENNQQTMLIFVAKQPPPTIQTPAKSLNETQPRPPTIVPNKSATVHERPVAPHPVLQPHVSTDDDTDDAATIAMLESLAAEEQLSEGDDDDLRHETEYEIQEEPISQLRCPVCDVVLEAESAEKHVNKCLDGSGGKSEPSSSSKPLSKPGQQSLMSFFGGGASSSNGDSNNKPAAVNSSSTNSGGKSTAEIASSSSHSITTTTTFVASPIPTFKRSTTSTSTTSIVSGASSATGDSKKSYWNKTGKSAPFYKKLPGTKFTVDAFSYGRIEGCTSYFLSHYHSDHYGGLTKAFTHGIIYCSKVTSNLVVNQLKVPPKYVKALPMNERVQVENVFVTLVDANHCPGAVLFLFEVPQANGKMSTYLHTGDFRASPQHIANPIINSQRLDLLYLDTTYCKPAHKFPPQDAVVRAVSELARRVVLNNETVQDIVMGKPVDTSKVDKSPPSMMKRFLSKANPLFGTPKKKSRTLFVCGTYLIGKEKVFVGIAKAISSKIYADANKRRILTLLEDGDIDSLLTGNADEADVHVVGMGGLNKEALTKTLEANKSVTSIIALRPTGWTFRPDKYQSANDLKPFTVTSLKPSYPTPQITIMGVPYSEHSSFLELASFVTSLNIGKVIPTVNMGNPKMREEMNRWFEAWKMQRLDRLMVADVEDDGDDLREYLSQAVPADDVDEKGCIRGEG
ncbi:hypothetical protein SmJEL517_g00052 [Synchytrium microbalum]|uniref:Metallo-beta-lactamase domain-containing protein n=1 Tax=Synchytrium microbalum TaxID=1806994 RepID=A0A507CJ92_9FUNG|nr:uncharacterized protein SmJEL517_g00052 [Synchytrium microbalum]TPX38264.1 hypothetical protein SmJEL517_g00052 [Synchytrium microbalum]